MNNKYAKDTNIINSLLNIHYKFPTIHSGDWLCENNEIGVPQKFDD